MSLDIFKLDGRVALITGGNRGLGFAMAKALAEAGANVVVTSRQEDRAMKSAASLATITGNALWASLLTLQMRNRSNL